MTTIAFFELFVSVSIQVTIVIGTTAWIAQRRRLEGESHRVWAACHILILVLVAMAVLVPHLRLLSTNSITAVVGQSAAVSWGKTLGTDLLFIWLTGVAIGWVALFLGTLQAIRIVRTAEAFTRSDHASEEAMSLTASGAGTQDGQATQLVGSSRTATAFCWQIHRPYIVLPEYMRAFPADELRGVIRHERAHLEAKHPLQLFLQRIVEILFWFHPVIWWASRRAAWSREFHCDAAAVTTAREAASYLRGLLRMTEQKAGVGLGLPAGLAFANGASMIQRRADRIAGRDWGTAPVPSSFARYSALLTFCSLIAYGIWLPVNADASSRSVWSPWPKWSAAALHELGVAARDFEIDGHRVHPHEHLATTTVEDKVIDDQAQ